MFECLDSAVVEDDERRGRATRLVVEVGGLEVFLSLFMVKEMRIEFTVQLQRQR